MRLQNVTPKNSGQCHCLKFVAPITNWKEVHQRHNQGKLLTKSLIQISDTKEDWIIDMFQCTDCGRYWACEDVGDGWVWQSYRFFYAVELGDFDNLVSWLRRNRLSLGILGQLDPSDPDYELLIAPNIRRIDQ